MSGLTVFWTVTTNSVGTVKIYAQISLHPLITD